MQWNFHLLGTPGSPYEGFAFINRATGPYAWAYWIMISCNVISPQLFWFKKLRTSIPVMFIVSIFVNIGMWLNDLSSLLHHCIEIFYHLVGDITHQRS